MVGQRESYIGDDVQSIRDLLALKYPVERGIVTNWDDMVKIWQYTYEKKLNARADKFPTLITEVPLNPKVNREKMTEVNSYSIALKIKYVSIQFLSI